MIGMCGRRTVPVAAGAVAALARCTGCFSSLRDTGIGSGTRGEDNTPPCDGRPNPSVRPTFTPQGGIVATMRGGHTVRRLNEF